MILSLPLLAYHFLLTSAADFTPKVGHEDSGAILAKSLGLFDISEEEVSQAAYAFAAIPSWIMEKEDSEESHDTVNAIKTTKQAESCFFKAMAVIACKTCDNILLLSMIASMIVDSTKLGIVGEYAMLHMTGRLGFHSSKLSFSRKSGQKLIRLFRMRLSGEKSTPEDFVRLQLKYYPNSKNKLSLPNGKH